MNNNDIAIIGIVCRLPMSDDIGTFWNHLVQGKELISEFTKEELLKAGISEELVSNPNYIPRAAVINGIDLFAASQFDISPHEAMQLDPQQRIFLELSYELLEKYLHHERNSSVIGVYAACGSNQYLLKNLYSDYLKSTSLEKYNLAIQNQLDFLATRVAYKLNLTGPAITLLSACSSSLTAVHLACQGILQGDCNMALAGGIALELPEKHGYLYQPGMILSSDGHCRTFDAAADGTVPCSGGGIILLKKLEDAIADNNPVYAIIKGSAINNDGHDKTGFAAPSITGQRQVIINAYQRANISARDVSYVEAHGTGTKLGDPIEIQALTEAYQTFTQDKQFCAIGSVKTNLGHADAAAGIIGLIKTALMLCHKEIPPSLNFHQQNPHIKFQNTPFYVNTTRKKWDIQNSKPRIAAVSSFGIGGTNAHIVLQEAASIKHKSLKKIVLKRESYWINNVSHNDPILERKPLENVKHIWMDCLGISEVEPHDNFFDLGGDSLMALILINKINESFNLNLNANSLITYPTFAEIAHVVDNSINKISLDQTTNNCILLQQSSDSKMNLFCIHPVGGTVFCYQDIANALAGSFSVYGIQDITLTDPNYKNSSIEMMAFNYINVIQQVQPHGPYYLLGSSFGGDVAYEIAQQLLQQGENVQALIMLDTPGPGHLPQKRNTNKEILDYLLELMGSKLNSSEVEELSDAELISYLVNNTDFVPKDFENKMQHILNIFRNNMALLYQYIPKPLPLHLTYFKAEEANPHIPYDLEKSWFPLLTKGMKVILIPGNHYSMLVGKNAKEIANFIETNFCIPTQ